MPQFMKEACAELRTRSFFKRFTEKQLLPLMDKMTVRQHAFNDVLFPED